MLSPTSLALILTLRPLPDLGFSISVSHYSPDTVSPGTLFRPGRISGNNHSQNEDMLRNTFFFQSPIQPSSSCVLGHTETWFRIFFTSMGGKENGMLVHFAWWPQSGQVLFCYFHSLLMNLHLH